MKKKATQNLVSKIREKMESLKSEKASAVSADALSNLDKTIDAHLTANTKVSMLKADLENAKQAGADALEALKAAFKLVKKQAKKQKKAKREKA